MLTDENAVVESIEDIGGGYRFLVFRAPVLAGALAPGQFIHIKVPGLEATALRRPFSVFDAAGGKVTVLFKTVGRGTEALARVAAGETLSVLGPLGHGFPLDGTGTPFLVGGGYGVAPLHFLARRLLSAPESQRRIPILFVGGRTAADLLALDRFEAMDIDVRIATNDGSAGYRGFVTGPLDETIEGYRKFGGKFELFTCGPDGLLKAVAERAIASGMPGRISMDRHMVCAVGACYACIQRVRRPDGTEYNARCCVNGPVFDAEELVW